MIIIIPEYGYMVHDNLLPIQHYVPKISYNSSAVIRNGRLRTYNIRLTSGGSRDYTTYKINNIRGEIENK